MSIVQLRNVPLVVLISLALACTPEHTRNVAAGRDAVDVHRMLLDELRGQLHQERPKERFDTAAVRFDSAESHAVPGLQYTWAVYRSEPLPHFPLSAVALQRSGALVIARGEDTWTQLAPEWRPRNDAEAVFACREISAVLANADPDRLTWAGAWDLDSIQHAYLPNDASAISGVLDDPPMVARVDSDSAIQVNMWYFDLYRARNPRRLAIQYRCRWSLTDAPSDSFSLTSLDSILGTGIRR